MQRLACSLCTNTVGLLALTAALGLPACSRGDQEGAPQSREEAMSAPPSPPAASSTFVTDEGLRTSRVAVPVEAQVKAAAPSNALAAGSGDTGNRRGLVSAQLAAPAIPPPPAESDGAELRGVAMGSPAPLAMRSARARGPSAPAKPMSAGQQARQATQDELAAPEAATGEAYDHITENRFLLAKDTPVSTFSIDTDTASYSNVRRFLTQGQRPPLGAVRIEELINYFDYDYTAPQGATPFAVNTEVTPAPWAPEHRLLRIGVKGKELATAELPPRNLVFLIDVSGSMASEDKLPLLQRAFSALLETLGERDRVAMVVYAGASGLVLPPTSGADKATIRRALDELQPGGSTNGEAGIALAYRVAEQAFLQGGANRVILATDGDFNVGTTSDSELVRLIEQKRKSGIFLSVLGFGMGNLKDSTMEKLADKGNGNYAYIDDDREARKVLVEQGGATLVTIAQDVKIQLEMNPADVGAYRLIGYENRALRNEDFHDDRKDAGELGAGHTVTALYELLTPAQAKAELRTDPLKYQRVTPTETASSELATVKLRYKLPGGSTSQLLEVTVPAASRTLEQASADQRFAASVAMFGMLLRESEHKGSASLPLVSELARGALGQDRGGYRREFLSLVERAQATQRQ